MKVFIRLTDTGNGTFKYLIVPVGKMYDPRYEWLDFSEERLKKIVANFKAGIPAYPPPVNVEHDSWSGKYGEIKDAEYNNGLLITVEPTEEGKKLIEEKKFEFMSVEIENGYDKTTGEDAGEILVGAALTNRPAHPAVLKIELSEDEIKKHKGGAKGMTPEEIEAMKKENERLRKVEEDAIKLAEENKKKDRIAVVDGKVKAWTEAGVPPIVAQKAKEIILGEVSNGAIKLSDGTSKDLLEAFDGMMGEVTKIDLGQHGKKKIIELSDNDGLKELDKILEEIK